MERIEEWLAEVQPDVVCMQETKLADDGFPALTFEALGYETAHYGQGQWNGVAILSRVGLDDVVTNFAPGIEPDPDARIITATCGGVRVSSCYVPNGRALDDHALHVQAELARPAAGRTSSATPSPAADVVVAGDFNIAPDRRRRLRPAQVRRAPRTSANPSAHASATLIEWGLTDLFRQQHPDAASVYSWWDYRAGDFHQGRGLRIDLVLGSASVAGRCEWATIDRNARKGDKPSDHAPVDRRPQRTDRASTCRAAAMPGNSRRDVSAPSPVSASSSSASAGGWSAIVAERGVGADHLWAGSAAARATSARHVDQPIEHELALGTRSADELDRRRRRSRRAC